MNLDDYIDEVIKLACVAKQNGDIPIGAIVIKDGIIIGKGYNTREKNNNVLGHAEVNSLIMAMKNEKNWNLKGSTMIVTLKPCSMCAEIIKQCRIDKVFYLVDKLENKKEYNKTKFIKIENIKEAEYKAILKTFFANLREKK